MKKGIILIITLGLLAVFPLMARAASAYSGSCGDGVTWKFDGRWTLTISGSGKMTENPWLKPYNSSIAKVVICDGVESIAPHAFESCLFLTSVDIPDSVESIGTCAFKNCIQLKTIDLPDSITSIESSAFYGCASLRKIVLPNSISFGNSPASADSSIISAKMS